MTLDSVIEDLTAWVQDNLCNVELLKPSSSNMSTDYETVEPTAFSLYVPPKDQLPPDTDAQIPSICVQFKEGSDDLQKNDRSLNFRLAFSAYRPGRFEETKDAEGKPVVRFVRNADGWKDLWLWVSRSLHKIYSSMYIEGVKIDRKTPVKYGNFSIDDNLVDAYPLWYAWIEFTVKCGVSPTNNDYNDFL